ncbi:hypothetical protein [Neisseria sp.]|uniref:hypothetical protein n=1 Tax=Neisseria sp. TaxID=192066 RepID=UPI0026DAA0C0|nr:hypothetical protein [Neisseria sp.]
MLGQIQTDSDIAKIVVGSIQEMLFKIALQMANDDYHQRCARHKEGIKLAQTEGRYKGRSPDQK